VKINFTFIALDKILSSAIYRQRFSPDAQTEVDFPAKIYDQNWLIETVILLISLTDIINKVNVLFDVYLSEG